MELSLSTINKFGESMERKLITLVLFRLLMITVLLGATALIGHQTTSNWSLAQYTIVWAIGIIYLMSILYSLAIKHNRNYTFQATTQIFVDLLLWSFLIYLTEGIHSPFTFLYSVSIIHGGVLLERRGALATGIMSALLLMVVLLFNSQGILHEKLGLGSALPSLTDPEIWYQYFLNISMLTLISFLSIYIAEQLRQREEVLAHRELSLNEQRMFNRSFISSLHSGFMMMDNLGRVSFANQAIEDLTGQPSLKLTNRQLDEIFPELKDVLPLELDEKEWERRIEVKISSSEKEDRWVSFSFTTLYNLDNSRNGSIIVTDETTKRHLLLENLRKSEKLAAVGNLAAGIAHEIRNPLASISGSIQMLSAELDLDEDNEKLMDIIMREVDRLNQLITDFLAYARPNPISIEFVNLREIMEDIINLLERRDHEMPVRFRVEFDPDLKDMFGDSQRIRQVLWNILTNAIDATRGMEIPPVVWISMENMTAGDKNAEQIRIKIRDNGSGMEEERMKHIFDPFFTTKAKGTGLGMSLVFQIVEMHNGEISVSSELGKGTSFTIDLPLHPENASKRPKRLKGAEHSPTNKDTAIEEGVQE